MTSVMVKQIVAELHPDLFADDFRTQFLTRCRVDRDKIQAKQEFWLEFLDSGIDEVKPTEYMSTWWNEAIVTQYDKNYSIDAEATTKVFARIVRWARSKRYKVSKEYSESSFTILVQKDDRFKTILKFRADRDVMCKRVHVGTKVVPAQPEQVVDEYDWECEKVSFLGIDTDN